MGQINRRIYPSPLVLNDESHQSPALDSNSDQPPAMTPTSTEDLPPVERLNSHPRFNLRIIAVIANFIGFILNVLVVLIVEETILSNLALVTVMISGGCNFLDLHFSIKTKRDLPVGLLFIFDTLGFLSFLALLIANGIVATHLDMRHANKSAGGTFLLAYASVPWIFCCYIHGFILLRDVLRPLFRNLSHPVCTHCRHDIKGVDTKPADSPLYQVAGDCSLEEDVENNAVPKDENNAIP